VDRVFLSKIAAREATLSKPSITATTIQFN